MISIGKINNPAYFNAPLHFSRATDGVWITGSLYSLAFTIRIPIFKRKFWSSQYLDRPK